MGPPPPVARTFQTRAGSPTGAADRENGRRCCHSTTHSSQPMPGDEEVEAEGGWGAALRSVGDGIQAGIKLGEQIGDASARIGAKIGDGVVKGFCV